MSSHPPGHPLPLSCRPPTRARAVAGLGALALALAACGDRAAVPTAPGAPAGKAAPTLLLAPEDLQTLRSSSLASGPIVNGTLQPERRADLRAEVAAVVVQVLKENGQPVSTGELLVRLDDTAIRDSLTSAEAAERAASQAFDQAGRQVQRQKTLQGQGMTSMQALEDAEIRRNNAQSELVAARGRVVAARQQLRRTEVRAPFDGVVSDRQASVGDTAQIGKQLVKVIDPRSMRFEGLVSADRLKSLAVGQPVHFRVNGFGEAEFTGTLRRIDAAANATTRQVAVIVGFDDPSKAPQVAGLFAEGTIEAGSAEVLMVAEAALVRAGEAVYAWRLDGNKLSKVALTLGPRDPRSGEYPVLTGLKPGDRILRQPGSTPVDGQAVEFARPAVPAAPVGPTALKDAALAVK